MRRRTFLGIAIGGVASAYIARHLPERAHANAINSAERRAPIYVTDNQGNYKGFVRDFHPRITFPAPADGQTHWQIYGLSPSVKGSMGPHFVLNSEHINMWGK